MTKSTGARIDRRGTRPQMDRRNAAACHHMVRDVAVSMAHACYEALMQRNDWYALWRNQNPELHGEALERAWVNAHWGDFIEGARAQLAETLRQPLDDGLRDAIAEALILDNTLVRGRKSGQRLIGEM